MNSNRLRNIALITCVLAACTGCVHTVKFRYQPGIPPAAALPCPVSLSLSPEYSSYQHNTPAVFMIHDEFDTPLGSALQTYAKYVAQTVFGDVEVIGAQPPRSESRLLLIPKVTSCELQPVFNTSPSSGTLGVRWEFKDPKSGQTLLMVPLQSNFTHSYGFSQSLSDVATGLMTNLTATTIQKFKSSKELPRLVAGSGDLK